jgi:hypothetical protein
VCGVTAVVVVPHLVSGLGLLHGVGVGVVAWCGCWGRRHCMRYGLLSPSLHGVVSGLGSLCGVGVGVTVFVWGMVSGLGSLCGV